jgi:L,D-peptidoglycan transpeptidase YkuD (ErfK/YbiS/YcfS/YnhG family)
LARPNGSPIAGCVALTPRALRCLLVRLGPKTTMEIS